MLTERRSLLSDGNDIDIDIETLFFYWSKACTHFRFLIETFNWSAFYASFLVGTWYRTKSKIFIACKCYGWHIFFFFFFFFQVKDEIQWMNVCILYYSLLKVIPVYPSFRSSGGDFNQTVNKGNNKTTELRTIPQRESQNSQLYKQTKSANNRKRKMK